MSHILSDEEIDELFDKLNNAYTFKECEEMQPFHPDSSELRVLGKHYNYDPNVSKLLQCYVDSIAVEPEAGIKDMNRLVVNFKKGMKRGAGLMSTTFVMNDNIIVKAPHFINYKIMSTKQLRTEMEPRLKENEDVSDYSRAEMIQYLEERQLDNLEDLNRDMKKEYIMGLLLNKLRFLTPNFMQTYGNVFARLPQYDYEHNDSDRVVSVGVTNKTGMYLFLEYAEGISLNRRVQAWAHSEDLHAIISCFLQIFYSLWIAQSKFQYVHSDLHSSNIIIIQLNEPVNIPYILPNHDIAILTTPYLVKMIDYGYSSATVPNTLSKETKGKFYGADYTNQPVKGKRIGTSGFNTEVQPMGPNLKSPMFDLFKILFDMLKSIYLVKKKEASFYFFTVYTTLCDYIYFLQKYWDKNRMPLESKLNDGTIKTTFGALTKKDLAEGKNLSMEGYYTYLNSVLFDYFKVRYLHILGGDSFNTRNNTNQGNTHKNQGNAKQRAQQDYNINYDVLYRDLSDRWFTCDKAILEMIKTKINIPKSNLQCWTLRDAKQKVNYHITNINMSVDYAMRHRLSKTQLFQKFPDMEKQVEKAYAYVEKELKAKSKVNPYQQEMHEVLLKITVMSLDFLYKTYNLGKRTILDKGKTHFFILS